MTIGFNNMRSRRKNKRRDMAILNYTMIILFLIIAFLWIVYFIGYPIYKKVIRREKFNWITYAIVLNILALCLKIIEIFL